MLQLSPVDTLYLTYIIISWARSLFPAVLGQIYPNSHLWFDHVGKFGKLPPVSYRLEGALSHYSMLFKIWVNMYWDKAPSKQH